LPEETLNLNLEGLKKFCENVSLYLKKGDIICLSGDLGSGKTTFSRYLINSIYKNQNKEPPNIIKSPSFPILLTYELSNFEIYHYDLYRVSKNSELIHLNIFEELNNSITLVEWPGTILDSLQDYNYFSIHFDFLDENTRILKHNLIFS
jgi:tRNA threonylcarbamoyl adenosine modification protein YjeE